MNNLVLNCFWLFAFRITELKDTHSWRKRPLVPPQHPAQRNDAQGARRNLQFRCPWLAKASAYTPPLFLIASLSCNSAASISFSGPSGRSNQCRLLLRNAVGMKAL